MRHLWLVLVLALFSHGASAAEFRTGEWRYHCWSGTGGSGARWCRVILEFVLRDRGERFRGTVRVVRPEGGAAEVSVTGDRPLDRAEFAVDAGLAHRCAEPFDCTLPPADATRLDVEMRTGQVLHLILLPHGMAAAEVRLALDGYRNAIQGLKHSGW